MAGGQQLNCTSSHQIKLDKSGLRSQTNRVSILSHQSLTRWCPMLPVISSIPDRMWSIAVVCMVVLRDFSFSGSNFTCSSFIQYLTVEPWMNTVKNTTVRVVVMNTRLVSISSRAQDVTSPVMLCRPEKLIRARQKATAPRSPL